MQLPRLPFRHVQLSSTGAAFPLLLRHGDLTKCQWNPDFCYVFYYSPAGAYTRLFLSGARATTSAILPHGRASTAARPLLFFVRGQYDFQAGSVLRTQGDRCSCKHALAAEGRRGLSLLVDVLAGVFRSPELLLGASGYRGP